MTSKDICILKAQGSRDAKASLFENGSMSKPYRLKRHAPYDPDTEIVSGFFLSRDKFSMN